MALVDESFRGRDLGFEIRESRLVFVGNEDVQQVQVEPLQEFDGSPDRPRRHERGCRWAPVR